MKKLKRLIEIKKQLRLARLRLDRANKRIDNLLNERNKLVKSFTKDEVALYKDRIEKACK